MCGGLAIQLGREFRISQRCEGLGDLCRFDVVVVNEEPLEERLVPLAPQVPGRGQVGVLAVGQQVERLAQRVFSVGEGCLGDFELPLGLVGLGGQPVLLLTQQVDWHRPHVVGVKELLALLGQLGDAAALAGGFGLGLCSHSGESFVQLLAYRRCLLARQPNLAIGALHRRLDQVDGYVGLFAARALHSPDAEEVGVAATVAVCLDQAHSRAATPAVERTLQVVVVLSVLLGGVVVGSEDGPGLGKGGGVDQVLLAALIFDPGVADGANVVGVLEQGGELRARERPFGLLRGGAGSQPPLCQGREQRVERVRARAVGGERPANMRRALGVDLDGADFLALDQLADVEIAEWSAVRRPA